VQRRSLVARLLTGFILFGLARREFAFGLEAGRDLGFRSLQLRLAIRRRCISARIDRLS